MDREYVVEQKSRLDEIVFKEYGSLEFFEEVLEANSHLVLKIFLDIGDRVVLPDFSEKIKELQNILKFFLFHCFSTNQ